MIIDKRELEKLKEKKKWDEIIEISDGYDPCLKYCVLKDNEKYLLKIFDKENLSKKQREFDILKQIKGLELTKPKTIEFGSINENYYFLLSWVNGKSLNCLAEQKDIAFYKIGYKIGKLIYKFHSFNIVDAKLDKISNIKQKLEIYKNMKFNLKNEEIVLSYIYNNIEVLEKQPISLVHGDLTETNIVLDSNGELGIIDFGNSCINYSYYDLHQVQMYNRFFNVDFSVGIIDGYIQEIIDKKLFWECFKIYTAYLSLYKIVWAQRYGKSEVENMTKRYYQTLEDFDNFKLNIPKWYSDYKKVNK